MTLGLVVAAELEQKCHVIDEEVECAESLSWLY